MVNPTKHPGINVATWPASGSARWCLKRRSSPVAQGTDLKTWGWKAGRVFFSEISVFGFPKSWKYQVPPNHPKLYGWPWLRNLKPMVLKWDPKNDVECNISEVDNGVNCPTTHAVSSNPQKYLLLISPSVVVQFRIFFPDCTNIAEFTIL